MNKLKESELKDILLKFEGISNVHIGDQNSNAIKSNFAYEK